MWESEFDIIVSEKHKVQDINISQLKLEVHDTYEKNEKMKTNFKAVNDSDIFNKAYQDEKLSKKYDHLLFPERYYNEFKLHYNKKSVEEVSIRRAAKTTIQKLYDKGVIKAYSMVSQMRMSF